MTELTDLRFYVVIPQYGINYVKNPVPYAELTGYTASGGGAIDFSDDDDGIFARRAGRCLKVTADNTASGAYYDPLPVVVDGHYVFSVDVLNEVADEDMRIYIANNSGTVKATNTFKSTGHWQRPEIHVQADATNASWRVYVVRDAGQGVGEFYVDGLQFEDRFEGTTYTASTFFWGYSTGFGKIGQNEYWWGGQARASYSYRSGLTRSGGRLLDIKEISGVTILSSVGLGMGDFKQIYTELVSGGAHYQKSITSPRNFSLILQYHGSNPGDLHEGRNEILEAIRPNYLGYHQEMIIRYQGFDADGLEATDPVDIVCVPQPSHRDLPNESINNRDVLSFTVLDGHLKGAFWEGMELDQYQDLTVYAITKRDKDGVWHVMGTGLVGQSIYCMAEDPNGVLHIGGTFFNAGGDANADYLAKWDNSSLDWVNVTGADLFGPNVHDMAFAPNGDLYVVGSFDNVGDANGDGIVKWDGTTLSSLGTGTISTIYAVAIDPNTGYVYVGGDFTSIGGVAGTARIAYWDGSTWNPLSTGLPGSVRALAFAPNGDLYIAGNTLTFSFGDSVGYWDGTSFNQLTSDVAFNDIIRKIDFDKNGNLIAVGDFTNAGGNSEADYIARFNGNQWENVGYGCNDPIYNIFIDEQNRIYAVGAFTAIGELTLSDRIAVYEGGAWRPLDIDLPGSNVLYSVYKDSLDNLYIAGLFGGAAVSGKVAVSIANNTGTTITYPFIQVRGPGTLQSIINYSTGRKVMFDGLVIQEGEWINLNFDPMNLKFESGWRARGNLLKYIIEGSDYGNFYLTPGANNISLFMPTGTGVNTDSWMRWTPLYGNLEGAKH